MSIPKADEKKSINVLVYDRESRKREWEKLGEI